MNINLNTGYLRELQNNNNCHRFGSSLKQLDNQQRMLQLANEHTVIRRMFDFIDIPSSTPQKDPRHKAAVEQNLNNIRDQVIKDLKNTGVTDIEMNEHGSLIVRVPGSKGYENARPLMLTAHMDIVPGDENNPTRPIRRVLKTIDGKEFIATDGTTTLGADDKGGLAMIIDNIARLKNAPHIPLEIILSPDEESSCDSLKKLDTSKFKAKHVLVVDEFADFKVTNGLASSVMINVNVSGTKGGHSGEEINKPNRLNAITLLSEILLKIKTGVIKMRKDYPDKPMISKNIGLIQGGSAPNAIPESAQSSIMLRSFDKNLQEKEIKRIGKIVQNFQQKHQLNQSDNFKIKMNWHEEYPAWQADPKSVLPSICTEAASNMGQKTRVGPTHAAAQASILANKTNAFGEQFDAVLIGPHIEEAHTVRERIDWKSLVQVNEWLGKIISTYTQQTTKNR